jgi:hypothetical protein
LTGDAFTVWVVVGRYDHLVMKLGFVSIRPANKSFPHGKRIWIPTANEVGSEVARVPEGSFVATDDVRQAIACAR